MSILASYSQNWQSEERKPMLNNFSCFVFTYWGFNSPYFGTLIQVAQTGVWPSKFNLNWFESKYLTIETDVEVFARVRMLGWLGAKKFTLSDLLISFSWIELSSKLTKWSNHVDDPTWKYWFSPALASANNGTVKQHVPLFLTYPPSDAKSKLWGFKQHTNVYLPNDPALARA